MTKRTSYFSISGFSVLRTSSLRRERNENQIKITEIKSKNAFDRSSSFDGAEKRFLLCPMDKNGTMWCIFPRERGCLGEDGGEGGGGGISQSPSYELGQSK